MKWLRAIHRDNFVPSVAECVSVILNQEILFQRFLSRTLKTGDIVSVKLNLTRLKEHSVPSKFPNCPEYTCQKLYHIEKAGKKNLKS